MMLNWYEGTQSVTHTHTSVYILHICTVSPTGYANCAVVNTADFDPMPFMLLAHQETAMTGCISARTLSQRSPRQIITNSGLRSEVMQPSSTPSA